MKKEQVETGVQATRNLLAETQYETRRSQYLQRRRELDSQITQLRHSIETKERKLDGLVNEEREVVKEGECKAGARNVDKNALKLKIYRMLGFELQLNSSIGSGNDGSAIDDKFEFLRVRSGANDDVVKFGMDQFLNGGSSVDLTNRLWNICSKDSVQPSSSC